MSLSLSLDTVPAEVLEHIAFFVAADRFLGPPTSLPPLLATNHRIYDQLSITSNPYLYARIFAEKFDTEAALAYYGEERLSSRTLAGELKRRCIFLKRIRQRIDSTLQTPAVVAEISGTSLEELLFQAYLMVTENVWKNERQLREYAKLDVWLREYWFDELGASRAIPSMRHDVWPPNDRRTTLAMWLFWFMLRSVDYPSNDEQTWTALNTLRVFALAAHKYSLTAPNWNDFLPTSYSSNPTRIEYYGELTAFTPPPLATPAILSFLTLVNKLSHSVTTAVPLPPSDGPALADPTNELSCEMYRCLSLGSGRFDKILTKSFKPGSLEGVWEGLFTYTEFTAYAALLAGAPPPVLQKSMVVRHQQTWKLREHHLLASDASRSDSGIGMDMDNVELLGAGDPLRSYFPTGTQITERRDGIEVREPGSFEPIRYRRPIASSLALCESDKGQADIVDVILTGEGHSAWGQFNLVGRVRPCDGFISLCKEYVDGDRGKWLYRGYLVGNYNGNFAGRWRDTLSPADVPGYEGCFAMSRRR